MVAAVVGYAKRFGLRFWNEPRFVVRFLEALVPLSLIALGLWWLSS